MKIAFERKLELKRNVGSLKKTWVGLIYSKSLFGHMRNTVTHYGANRPGSSVRALRACR